MLVRKMTLKMMLKIAQIGCLSNQPNRTSQIGRDTKNEDEQMQLWRRMHSKDEEQEGNRKME